MVALVPDEPKSHYNLGVLYRQNGKLDDAQKEFEITAKLDPNLAAPHFQLFNIFRQQGRKDAAAGELKIFTGLKKSQEGAAIAEDMEWCDYAEIWDPIDMKPLAPEPAPKFETRKLAGDVDSATAGLLVLDSTGAGRADLLVWSSKGILLYRHGQDLVKDSGLDGITGVISVASGDFDNDGLPDLCVVTEKGPQLWRNVKGQFTRFAAPTLPDERFDKAIWIDYDHDYDLDLLLLGEHSRLFRNQGQAGFADHTEDYPLPAGHAIDGVVTRVFKDSKAFDLVVSYSDHAGAVILDGLGEHFEAKPLPELPAGARNLRTDDFNHDGWLDLSWAAGALVNEQGVFKPATGVIASGGVRADFDNDGRNDRAMITPAGIEVELNRRPKRRVTASPCKLLA